MTEHTPEVSRLANSTLIVESANASISVIVSTIQLSHSVVQEYITKENKSQDDLTQTLEKLEQIRLFSEKSINSNIQSIKN